MTKLSLLPLATGCIFMASGCSSVMSHTGDYQGFYPGSRSDVGMIKSHDSSWAMTPLLVLDLPFSAMLDTLLLPYDYYKKDQPGTLDRIKTSEQHNLAISHSVDIGQVPSVPTASQAN